jgi:hypothetical protein
MNGKTIVAFLQNMWFKEPERAKKILDRYVKNGDGREVFIRDMLFAKCLTGRRLMQALGEGRCMEIIWEEASPEIGGHSRSKFAYDSLHMAEVIRKHKPDVILCFGLVAYNGLAKACDYLGNLKHRPIICGPHPASRSTTVMQDLRNVAKCLEEELAK